MQRGTGDFPVTKYDCRASTNCIATFRVEFESRHPRQSEKGDIQDGVDDSAKVPTPTETMLSKIFAYSTFDEKYKNLVEEGLANHYLEIFSNNSRVRTLKMESCVMQVMSTRSDFSDQQVEFIVKPYLKHSP